MSACAQELFVAADEYERQVTLMFVEGLVREGRSEEEIALQASRLGAEEDEAPTFSLRDQIRLAFRCV